MSCRVVSTQYEDNTGFVDASSLHEKSAGWFLLYRVKASQMMEKCVGILEWTCDDWWTVLNISYARSLEVRLENDFPVLFLLRCDVRKSEISQRVANFVLQGIARDVKN